MAHNSAIVNAAALGFVADGLALMGRAAAEGFGAFFTTRAWNHRGLIAWLTGPRVTGASASVLLAV